MEDVALLFDVQEKNEEWFNANYAELRRKFEDKFLAIGSKEVLAADEDIENLLRVLQKRKVDIDSVFITSIPSKGAASIL